LGSYKTAWAMLHKLRRAMVRPGREPAGGRRPRSTRPTGREKKPAQRGRQTELENPHQSSRRRGWKWHRPHPSAPRSGRLQSQPARIYSAGRCTGQHGPEPMAGPPIWGCSVTSMIASAEPSTGGGTPASARHRVISLMKRWLLGTHQGAVSPEHLGRLLGMSSRSDSTAAPRNFAGKLFYRLAQQAVRQTPFPSPLWSNHNRLYKVASSKYPIGKLSFAGQDPGLKPFLPWAIIRRAKALRSLRRTGPRERANTEILAAPE